MSEPVGSIQANLVVDDPNQIVVLQKYKRRYRNFYKIEKWSWDGQRVEKMFAWNISLTHSVRETSKSRLTIGKNSRIERGVLRREL